MRRRRAISTFAAIVSLVLLLAPLAHADGDADEAELSFQLGASAYRQGDYQRALQHFLASNRLVRNRNVMFNIARSYEQLGRFPDAFRYYMSSLEGETDPRVRQASEDAITRITPKIAVITVATSPPGATIYLDRTDLGSVGVSPARLGLPAGTYTVLVTLPGHEPARREALQVSAGSTVALDLTLVRITGTLRFVGEAGAEIRLDDEDGPPACVSPCQLSVAPGPHVVFFAREGGTAVPRRVEVRAGQSLDVKVSVQPLTGSLLVQADEPSALIEIDGQPVGFTPAVIRGVSVGRHTVRVSLRGHQAVETEVVVRAGEQLALPELSLPLVRQIDAASRTSESVDDAPASVTVISAQELEAFAYPSVLEALRGIRGFALSYDSTYGNASVRGLGRAGDFGNRLLVLTDGALLNEDVLYQPFIHYDGRVDLGDVERIEVVRGPGSVLYGTGAVSGVVNLVTRGIDEPSQAEVAMSTAGDSVARVRGSFQLRLPAGAGVWASLAAARSQGRDVALRFDADGDGRDEDVVAHDVDRFDAWTAAGRAWKDWLTLQWFYTRRDLLVPTGAYGSIFDRTDNTYADERGLLELRVEPPLSDSVQLLGRVYLNRSRFASDFVYAGDPDEETIHEEYRGDWAGAELRVVATPRAGLRLSIGGEVARHFDVTMTSDSEIGGEQTSLLDVSAPYTVIAGYASVDHRVHPRVKLVAGVRVDRWDLSQGQLGFTSQPLTDDFTSVNPRLAVILRPTDADVIKLMGGRAFRAPSTYEYFYTDGLFTQATSDCCSDTPLVPETVWSGEVEASHAFSSDLRVLVSGFALLAEDTIETVPVPEDIRVQYGWEEGIFYYTNSAVAQLVLGGEVEVRREWRGGRFLAASYGLQSSRYTASPEENSPTFAADRRVPNQPTHMAAFRAVTPLVANRLNGALRVSVEGGRRVALEDDATTAASVVADVVLSGRAGDLGLRWHAGVYNLFDWEVALPASPYASPVMPQLGRSLLLGVSLTR